MSVFRAWDFTAQYAPVELEKRGVASLPARTYPYAKTALAVWTATHTYVTKVVAAAAAVAGGPAGTAWVERDERLAAWVAQLREPDWLPSFPDIRDDAALINA
jgi:hypothetical protein